MRARKVISKTPAVGTNRIPRTVFFRRPLEGSVELATGFLVMPIGALQDLSTDGGQSFKNAPVNSPLEFHAADVADHPSNRTLKRF